MPASELQAPLRELGAQVDQPPAETGPPRPHTDALVLDCSAWIPTAEPAASLQQLLDQVWQAVELVANSTLIAGGQGGRIVFVAPAQRDRPGAPAATAALENLGRTLSVEWARYRITVCTVAPSAETSADDLSTVVAYVLSPAGGYFSGARLDLNALSA